MGEAEMVRNHTEEVKQRISETQKRRYALQGGLTEEHKRNISAGQKRRWAEIAKMVALVRETRSVLPA